MPQNTHYHRHHHLHDDSSDDLTYENRNHDWQKFSLLWYRPSPSDVEVQVEDILTSTSALIASQPVARFCDTGNLRNLSSDDQKLTEHCNVRFVAGMQLVKVAFGNNQDMNACDGVDVLEREHIVVFIYL